MTENIWEGSRAYLHTIEPWILRCYLFQIITEQQFIELKLYVEKMKTVRLMRKP